MATNVEVEAALQQWRLELAALERITAAVGTGERLSAYTDWGDEIMSATIRVTYKLSTEGQRAALLAGVDASEEQSVCLPVTPELAVLADVSRHGEASINLYDVAPGWYPRGGLQVGREAAQIPRYVGYLITSAADVLALVALAATERAAVETEITHRAEVAAAYERGLQEGLLQAAQTTGALIHDEFTRHLEAAAP